ncbi:MAG: arylesterase [Candidatus Polarisedimenticolaceae bacterium]|nr:arylesterase [Candidatus Polarisedimenticolaceae bacterium]
MKWFYRTLIIFLLVAVPPCATASETILVLGDSLSAAFGIEKSQGWVNLLRQRLKQHGYDYHVINASISGETTSGGLARLQPLLKRHQPAIVILELGVNDGLRGQPLRSMRKNIQQIIRLSQQQGKLLLVGMHLPTNYGAGYTHQFHRIYSELAQHNGVPLVSFLMQGLEDSRRHFLPDRLHPNAAAQPVLLSNIWEELKPLLRQ